MLKISKVGQRFIMQHCKVGTISRSRKPVILSTKTCLDSPLIALILLENGADTVIKDNYGFTPLQLASGCFHVTTYRILLEADDFTVGKLGTSLLRLEMHILKASSSKETESNIDHKTFNGMDKLSPVIPLRNVMATSVDCDLNLTLNEDHDSFFQTRYGIQYATENGDPIIAQTLMDADVDLNNYEEKGDGPRHRLPLEMKVPKGLVRIVEVLVKHVKCEKAKDASASNISTTTLANGNGEWRVALFLVTFLAT